MAEIKEIWGNLFNSECKTIVNTINCIGVMGKGIALEFKYRFPEMFDEYVLKCEKKEIRPGLLWIWKARSQWILNFPTKYHWKYPSKMEYIRSGLEYFKRNYRSENINTIAFPILGTHSGGLDEAEVLQTMQKNLSQLPDLYVEIYHWDSNANDKLFERLKTNISNINQNELTKFIKINKRAQKILSKSLESNQVRSMFDLREVKGLGEGSMKEIYAFASTDIDKKYNTNMIKQKELKFTSYD